MESLRDGEDPVGAVQLQFQSHEEVSDNGTLQPAASEQRFRRRCSAAVIVVIVLVTVVAVTLGVAMGNTPDEPTPNPLPSPRPPQPEKHTSPPPPQNDALNTVSLPSSSPSASPRPGPSLSSSPSASPPPRPTPSLNPSASPPHGPSPSSSPSVSPPDGPAQSPGVPPASPAETSWSWTLQQTVQRDGYQTAHLDFSPDGNRLAIAWQNRYHREHEVVDVYEWHGDRAAWTLLSSLPTYVNYGVRMPSPSAVWVGQGCSASSLQKLVLDESLTLGSAHVSFGVNNAWSCGAGFNFDVYEGGNGSIVALGYPLYSTPGRDYLGQVEVVRVNATGATPREVLYTGRYVWTNMGQSVAVDGTRVAISGRSTNMPYPEDGPAASAGIAVVASVEQGETLGDPWFGPSGFQFTRVALRGDTLAVMVCVWTIEVRVFRWDGVAWRPRGDVIVLAEPKVDGNHVHLALGEDRVAFGGVGFVGFEYDEPGAMFVYEYRHHTGWTPVGRPVQSGARRDEFARGMAFTGDRLAASARVTADRNRVGLVKVRLYHLSST